METLLKGKSSVSRATLNQRKASARKKKNRKKRDQVDAAEARRLGITPWELRQRRFREAERICPQGKNKPVTSSMISRPLVRSSPPRVRDRPVSIWDW